ncbi:MAG: hypothetical protein AAF231_12895, partial [Pseudomonadota bacterium]
MSINEMTAIVTLSQPVYNPEATAFEAKATLRESGAEFAYRVAFPAAPHAEFEIVTKGLKTQALAQHAQARERTQRFLRETVRAATSRANSPALGGFLAA